LSNGKVLAIAILFLFVIMMLNIKIVELSETKTFYSYNYPLILLLGIGYYLIIITQSTIGSSFSNISYWFDYIHSVGISKSIECNINEITLFSISGAEFNWDSLFISLNQVINIGYILYSYHAISLVVISAILLLAMVSPIILCFSSKNNSPPWLLYFF